MATAAPYKRQFEHGDLLVMQEISLLDGYGASGKTAYTVAVTLGLASGVPLLGQKIYRRRKVLVISLEENIEEMRLKYQAAYEYFAVRFDLPADTLEWITILGAGDAAGLTFTHSVHGIESINAEGYALLRRYITESGAEVVILDPVMMLFPVGSNNNGLIYPATLGIKRAAADLNCAILLVAHTKKGASHGAAGVEGVEGILGAVALSNAARVAKGISGITPEDASAIGVPYGEESSIRRIVDQKANFTPAGEGVYIQLKGQQVDNALPPDYPDGDWVSVATEFRPQLGARTMPHPALRDALVTLARGAQAGLNPFSPSKAGGRGQSRYYGPDVARAIAAHFPNANARKLEQAAKDAFTDVCERGWAEVADMKVGPNTRKGIRVKWSATPWAADPQPGGPYVV